MVLGLGLLVGPLAVEGQQPGRVHRVGRLSTSATPASIEAFRRGLVELGWAPDRDLVIEIRHAEGKPERLPALATELVQLKVEVIVAAGSDAVEAAWQATRSIPIVMAVVDGRHKTVRIGQVFHPTEDMEEDMKTIKGYFDGIVGINPRRKYITLET